MEARTPSDKENHEVELQWQWIENSIGDVLSPSHPKCAARSCPACDAVQSGSQYLCLKSRICASWKEECQLFYLFLLAPCALDVGCWCLGALSLVFLLALRALNVGCWCLGALSLVFFLLVPCALNAGCWCLGALSPQRWRFLLPFEPVWGNIAMLV